MLDDVPTLTVNVPSCLLIPLGSALTNVCDPVYGEPPTLTENVLSSIFVISNQRLLAASYPARGY